MTKHRNTGGAVGVCVFTPVYEIVLKRQFVIFAPLVASNVIAKMCLQRGKNQLFVGLPW